MRRLGGLSGGFLLYFWWWLLELARFCSLLQCRLLLPHRAHSRAGGGIVKVVIEGEELVGKGRIEGAVGESRKGI